LRCAAPELGQDNEAILTELGYSKEEIAELEKEGVI
jgi:crotonobetainyl-CoA:carnitine CoA-transferase CaiB-like acyl-CoA transferase